MTQPSTGLDRKASKAPPAESFDFPDASDMCDFGYALAESQKDEKHSNLRNS